MLSISFDCRALRHCCTLYLSLLVVVLINFVSPAASHLLSIPLTSPSLVYTPFVCNVTEVSLDPNVCQEGWQLSDDPPQVSTTGSPKPILPQIFFRFRASGIYITTSADSNATVAITVAWESVIRRSDFDSSLGFIDIMDLPDNSTFLLTVTVNPSTSPTLFGLTSIEITTPPDAVISSVLPPTITLSSPIFPTQVTSQTTSRNTFTTSIPSRGDEKLSPQMVKVAIGLTVGLGVGLTLVAILTYWLLRWRRRTKSWPRRWSFVT